LYWSVELLATAADNFVSIDTANDLFALIPDSNCDFHAGSSERASMNPRTIAEGLTEEELALFDILTKPEPVLTKAEEAEVKRVCRELLATLKREKLVLDWRETQQARASVMQTLKTGLYGLPKQ
jgi:hypothetical protein